MYTIGFTFFAPSNDVGRLVSSFTDEKKNINEVKTQSERKEVNVKKMSSRLSGLPFFSVLHLLRRS